MLSTRSEERVGQSPSDVPPRAPDASRRQRWLPPVTLFLLAPIVAELLAGTMPVWQVGNLLFLLPLYGSGALLIRELVRRRGRGWTSILLLGAAFGIVEEGIASHALFSPNLYGVAA